MGAFGLFAESLTRCRIRQVSEHQRAPRRFPVRAASHPTHRPLTRPTPSRHNCEQYVPCVSFLVQRTAANTLPHLSHASLTQTPYSERTLACTSAVILMVALPQLASTCHRQVQWRRLSPGTRGTREPKKGQPSESRWLARCPVFNLLAAQG